MSNRIFNGISVKKKAKGSFTVEAAFIMPMISFMLMFALNTGITMHQETCCAVEDIRQAEEIQTVKLFWRASRMEELKSLVSQDGTMGGEGR